ncbi:MAG TPA: hypothetical protein PLV68_18305 [Ilumatobacteraceae bacterium]|nr:hypothetical protein [Ilumatobacteraceae bacterium]
MSDRVRVREAADGLGWRTVTDDPERQLTIVAQATATGTGFVPNVVVQVLPVEPDFDLAATVPTAAVVLAQSGLDAGGDRASIMLIEPSRGVCLTQQIEYRFRHDRVTRLVASADTADWPGVAGDVQQLIAAMGAES